MVEKIKFWIGFIYGVLFAIFISKPLLVLRMFSKSTIRFENLKLVDGTSFTQEVLLNEFATKGKALTLLTNSGKKIDLVHGYGQGFMIEGKAVSYEEMASHFDAGNYTLVSCGNAYHSDYFTNDKAFFVERSTSTRYQIQAVVHKDTTYFASDKMVDIEPCLLALRFDLVKKMIAENKSLAEVLGIV